MVDLSIRFRSVCFAAHRRYSDMLPVQRPLLHRSHFVHRTRIERLWSFQVLRPHKTTLYDCLMTLKSVLLGANSQCWDVKGQMTSFSFTFAPRKATLVMYHRLAIFLCWAKRMGKKAPVTDW